MENKTVCNCGLIHLIGLDGGLRHINPTLVEDLQKIGWKVVVNPKRTYYPEHDTTNPHYKSEDVVEQTDILKAELV